MTKHIFVSPTGAEAGSERYFEEAIAAGYYGVDDAESHAFTIRKPLDPTPWNVTDPVDHGNTAFSTLAGARSEYPTVEAEWMPDSDYEQDPAFYPVK